MSIEDLPKKTHFYLAQESCVAEAVGKASMDTPTLVKKDVLSTGSFSLGGANGQKLNVNEEQLEAIIADTN